MKFTDFKKFKPQLEKDIHKSVCEYLKIAYPKCLFNSDMSGVWLNSYSTKNSASQLRYAKGYPDIFIPEPRGGYFGLYIELKSDKGTTSKEQKQWQSDLQDRGFQALVCKGFDQAKLSIDKYLAYPETLPLNIA